jgi:predicted phosphodiesterase
MGQFCYAGVMKLAILTDVHGNRFALEAVLRDIEANKPDSIANLGDQVWGAADPAGAWTLQQSLGAVTVRGNTDEFMASNPSELSVTRIGARHAGTTTADAGTGRR